MAPPPPESLFDDSDSGEDRAATFSINEEYGRRMEHNRRREDLQRLEELKKQGIVSSSSSSSSSDDAVGSARADLQFFDALVKVKHKDPLIHHKDAKLYSESTSSSSDDDDEPQKKDEGTEKMRPLYIKDVTARHLLDNGPEFEDEEEREPAEIQSQAKVYSKEQEENRRRFLQAAAGHESDDDDDDDEGGDFFTEKPRGEPEGDPQEDWGIRRKMDEYWGEDGNLDEDELFLKNFLLKKMWAGKGDDHAIATVDDGEELSEDEDELERQERYEAEYNFRHEEGVGDVVMGHSREVEGSVRKKKSNVRKEQRRRKEERMAQAEQERREEVKRLKNLKKKEIRERLERIRAIAGIGDGGECGLGADDLEEEFDPEEYDRKMKEVFGMEYYKAEDADPEFGGGDEDGLEKPNFGKEDELLGLPKGWDVIGEGEGFKTARERSLKNKENEVGPEIKEGEEEDEEEEEVANGDQQRESKRKRKRKISLREKVELDLELEEYYKLDYEDTIGDLKTRFKYKSVLANRYGLNTAEILMADDRDLNQYVSLKKLVPYGREEWKVHKVKRHQMKMKLYDQGGILQHGKGDNKKRPKGSDKKSRNETVDAVPSGQASGQDIPSRRSRRRRRQSQLKLSQSRLMAYGKVPRNPKKQKKH